MAGPIPNLLIMRPDVVEYLEQKLSGLVAMQDFFDREYGQWAVLA